LAFADDPGWTDELAVMLRGDGQLSSVLADGLVAVLGRWRAEWHQRPVAVVALPSRRAPQRLRSMAEHIAAIGRLPLVDVFDISGPRPPTDTASGARVAALVKGLTLRPDVALPAGPVLLLDDTYRTGWTMTVAAALLRDAGATAVLPLVVHQLP
jgi:ATP-dependent DNA helicase RecQ